MKGIDASETLLAGQWKLHGERLVADEACERIFALLKSHLREIGREESGWNVLYRDPDDGRYWELLYPQGALHGGGPPQLRCIPAHEAEQKYFVSRR